MERRWGTAGSEGLGEDLLSVAGASEAKRRIAEKEMRREGGSNMASRELLYRAVQIGKHSALLCSFILKPIKPDRCSPGRIKRRASLLFQK